MAILKTATDIFTANLRRLRLAKGWSQERLAELAEMSAVAISLLENGARFPQGKTLDALSAAFGVPVHELLLDSGAAETPDQASTRVMAEIIEVMRLWAQMTPIERKGILVAMHNVTALVSSGKAKPSGSLT